MRPISRDMQLHIAYGDIRVSLIAEGVSWSPDVAQDMVNRGREAWSSTLEELALVGLTAGGWDDDDEEDDDAEEYGPTPDSELIDPRIIYVREED